MLLSLKFRTGTAAVVNFVAQRGKLDSQVTVGGVRSGLEGRGNYFL